MSKKKKDPTFWKSGYRASAMYQPMAASKIRPIADKIRGEKCVSALSRLTAMPNKGAKLLKKVLLSAMANAQDRDANIDEESLYVEAVMINEGARQKKIWRRGRGRADIQQKRSAHLYVKVEESKSESKSL